MVNTPMTRARKNFFKEIEMEELAVFEMSAEVMPKDLDKLRAALERAGLNGTYRAQDDTLAVEWEGDRYLFQLYDAYDADGMTGGPGVEVMGKVADPAASLIDLAAIFNNAFPGCRGSSAWGEL
jgi:hypothetical protein